MTDQCYNINKHTASARGYFQIKAFKKKKTISSKKLSVFSKWSSQWFNKQFKMQAEANVKAERDLHGHPAR